jgi:hypothetical protein
MYGGAPTVRFARGVPWAKTGPEQDSSVRVISPKQRPLPDNTHYSEEADIRAPCGIRTRDPRKRGASDPNLRPHDYWNQRNVIKGTNLLWKYLLTPWSTVLLEKLTSFRS